MHIVAMGNKKKHERSKSSKKHKHKKHKKKKDKTHVSDVSDAHETSDFEATASTQEALEQYDRILLALKSEDVKLEEAEPETGVDISSNVCPSAQGELSAKDGITLPLEQPDIPESGNRLPCSEDKSSFDKEKIQLQSRDDLQSKDGQLQQKHKSRSQSSSRGSYSHTRSKHHRSRIKNHQSRSRDHRSRSGSHQPRNRQYHSRSRDRQSRSRNQRSRSRERRSRSRDRKSRSRGRRSRSRGRRSRSREQLSRSRDSQHLRRHYRSSSRSLSRGRSRSHQRESRRRRSSSSSRSRSRNSWSYSPKRGRKIVVEKVEPPRGSLESFTTLCQQLAKQVQELPVINFPIDDENIVAQQQPIRAPFNVGTQGDLVFHNNAWKTSMQVMTEKTMTSSVTEIFPCSSGADHCNKGLQETSVGTIGTPTPPQEPVDIGALSQRRIQLQQQLQANPMDIQAYSSYLQVEQQIAEWSNAQKVPGQFTGQKKVTGLTGKDLHATGRQAWVKKDMFTRLDPVRSDFGLKLMKKMGWVEGTPLGKTGVGHIVPPVLSFQVDRKGLVSEIDSVKVAPPPNAIKSTSRNIPSMFKGKHPVSALQELAAKKQWVVSYDEANIPGKPGFCYKVTLPLGTFQPEQASATKKQAKLHTALNCLVGIGALPPDEAKSILESQT